MDRIVYRGWCWWSEWRRRRDSGLAVVTMDDGGDSVSCKIFLQLEGGSGVQATGVQQCARPRPAPVGLGRTRMAGDAMPGPP